jgi:hypothetical protein
MPNGLKILQMSQKYTNIFHSKALQDEPKLAFLVWKHTIWQPCPAIVSNYKNDHNDREPFLTSPLAPKGELHP